MKPSGGVERKNQPGKGQRVVAGFWCLIGEPRIDVLRVRRESELGTVFIVQMKECVNRRTKRVGETLCHDPVALVCTEAKCIHVTVFPEPTVYNYRCIAEKLRAIKFVVWFLLRDLIGQPDEENARLRRPIGVVKTNQMRAGRGVRRNGGLVHALFVRDRFELDSGMISPRRAWPSFGWVGCRQLKLGSLLSAGRKNTGHGRRLGQAAWPTGGQQKHDSDSDRESVLPHANNSLIGDPPFTMGKGRPVLVCKIMCGSIPIFL